MMDYAFAASVVVFFFVFGIDIGLRVGKRRGYKKAVDDARFTGRELRNKEPKDEH